MAFGDRRARGATRGESAPGWLIGRAALGAATVAIVVSPLVVAGCGGGASAEKPASSTLAPVQSGTVNISSRDNNFVPDVVTVTSGSEIVWRNDGRTDHDIVPVGDAPMKVDKDHFKPGTEYKVTLNQPGVYHYYCSIHGTEKKGMVGTIEVVPRPAGARANG